MVPGGGAVVSKYLLNKFLFTVDRNATYVDPTSDTSGEGEA